MKTLGAIKRNPTLADRAYEIIKEAIIANELKPGQVLTEEGLAEKLQISRTPIKSALLRLVYEEIAEYNGSKNVVVSDITEKSIEDITVVRKSLEPLAILLLENKIAKSEIEELKETQIEQSYTVDKRNSKEFIDLDYKFHTKIAELTGNTFLSDMVRKANLITKRFLILSGTLQQHSRVASEEHEKIIYYLEKGDFNLASKAMEEHLDKVNKRMLIR